MAGRPFSSVRSILSPKPVDQRVLLYVAPAVAAAAAESNVAASPIEDMQAYRDRLAAFLGRTKQVMAQIENKARQNPRSWYSQRENAREFCAQRMNLFNTVSAIRCSLGRQRSIEEHARELQIPLDGIGIWSIQRATKPAVMQLLIAVSDTRQCNRPSLFPQWRCRIPFFTG